MFDYILTGPISGVSAGQYIAGLINDTFATAEAPRLDTARPCTTCFTGRPHVDVNWTSVIFALIVTIYFWWQNTKGIQESSEKALRVIADHHGDGGHPAGLVCTDPAEAGIPVGTVAHRR